MISVSNIKPIALAVAFALLSVAGARAVMAQSPPPSTAPTVAPGTAAQDAAAKNRPRTTGKTTDKKTTPIKPGQGLDSAQTTSTPTDIPAETQANRREQVSEENAVVPFYNNFFNTYRLGPEDVISVQVFGQDRYSRSGIIIPPSGRISLALIQGGLFVNGKTVDEVAELIKKRYDEYIIDPQVTVSLEKASSYRYSIIGDVAQPGIRLMSRRLTVTEAIAEAGGVLGTGDKSRVTVLRRQSNNVLAQIPVNVSAIYKGRVADSTYLIPGDQIVVPGNKLKKIQSLMGLVQVLSFARIFATGGF